MVLTKLTHFPQNKLEPLFCAVVHLRSILQIPTTVIITIASCAINFPILNKKH